jgi:hypothetical protein
MLAIKSVSVSTIECSPKLRPLSCILVYALSNDWGKHLLTTHLEKRATSLGAFQRCRSSAGKAKHRY